jgi:type II secretory pathway pseudopilin PulG
MACVTSSTPKAERPRGTPRAFTLVEVLIAAGISVVVLAGVLTANLQVIRGGVRATEYAEMEAQVRRALDMLGRDLREALDIKWNSESDLTLTIPTDDTTVSQVTYAWTAASGAFFRVAGARSDAAGRLELVRGIRPLPGNAPGAVFTRFDRDGAEALTDDATKSIQITLTTTRTRTGMADMTQAAVSARFLMRNKATN